MERGAFWVIKSNWRDLLAAVSGSAPPTASAADPARSSSEAVSRETPPEGTSGTSGNGPLSEAMYLAPPTALQGKTLTKSEPAFQAAITSVGVSAPAKITGTCGRASFTVSGCKP